MQLQSIRDVSKGFGISTRTLRYYEEVGLIQSVREGESTYRAYDGEALRRLKQILVLRAMRLPLKQIRALLVGDEIADALAALERHVRAVQQEMDALHLIQIALAEIIRQLRSSGHMTLSDTVLDEESTRTLLHTLAIPIPEIKEEETMTKITDVRIVYLPPATVCAARGMGPGAEQIAGDLLKAFAVKANIAGAMPGARVYGFNHPNGEKPDGSDHGYELWMTIPEDMPVEAPYEKKHFEGGEYAAHMIPMGAFEEWQWLFDWVSASPEWELRWGAEDCMNGFLEEHLNYQAFVKAAEGEGGGPMQLDLLMPVKGKKKE